MPSDAEMMPLLNREVEKLLRDCYGKKTSLVGSEPERIDRRYSFMFRYALIAENGNTCYVLVKIPHHPWMLTIEEAIASEQLRADVKFEFEVLKSLERVISDSGDSQLCAVKPVGVISNWNAIVVEELPLKMLKDYLAQPEIMLGSKKAWRSFSERLYLAGKWLRITHRSFSNNKSTALNGLDTLELTLKEITLLEKRRVSGLGAIHKKINNLYAGIANEQIPLSSVHDDYHLGNVFVTDQGKVGALDPNWKENRSIFGDLSKLLVDPPVRKLQVALRGLSFRSSLQNIYEREILSGYFDGMRFSHAVLWFYCAFAVLEKWNLSEETLETNKSRVFTLFRPLALTYIRSYFLGLVNQYLNKGLQALSTRVLD